MRQAGHRRSGLASGAGTGDNIRTSEIGNAIWLLLALPSWYVLTLAAPLGVGALWAIPALGIICLIVGARIAIHRRDARMLSFLLLPLLAEIFVACAGFMRGRLSGDIGAGMAYAFLAGQLALAMFLTYRVRDAWVTAILLAVFSMTYSAFAAFIAVMAFSDRWL